MATNKTNTIISRSEMTSARDKNFFKPAPAEIGLYFLLCVVLLMVFNAGNIIQTLSNNYIGSPEHLKASFSTLAEGFSRSFTGALGGRLGQIILWSFVGALAYIGLWAAKNMLNSFENDVITDHYLHPTNYTRTGYWSSSFSVKIFLLALLLVSVSYLFLLLTAVLPSLAALAGSAAYNFHGGSSALYILFSIIGGTLAIYIGVALWRLVSHLWKLL